MSSELYQTIEQIGREKGLDTEIIIQALEEAYAAATRKYHRSKKDLGARLDRQTGDFTVFSKQVIVEEDDLADPQTEVTIEEARVHDPDAELGMTLEKPYDVDQAPLTRIAAQAAKQVIYQKVKEAERELIWREYGDKIGDLLTGQVKRFDRGDMIVDLGRTEGMIPRREQSRAEHYNPGDRVRAVLINVERLGKGPQLTLSRASELLVKKLFEMEVPEIYDATVSIVNVSRDAGERSKVSVRSKDRDVDPVGACVGMKGSRVQAVIRELRGEKIDIVQFDDDSSQYVRNSLNPATINRVAVLDYDTREMEVIVAEDQLSLAIGKRGQNVRLASKLVGWSLDIKSEAEKKAEVEVEMERMERATQELGSLEGITPAVRDRLLDVGFRTVEEVSLASMEDLTSIDGVDEETAIDIHDAAEILYAKLVAEAEAAALASEEEEDAADADEDWDEAALEEGAEDQIFDSAEAAEESGDDSESSTDDDGKTEAVLAGGGNDGLPAHNAEETDTATGPDESGDEPPANHDDKREA